MEKLFSITIAVFKDNQCVSVSPGKMKPKVGDIISSLEIAKHFAITTAEKHSQENKKTKK